MNHDRNWLCSFRRYLERYRATKNSVSLFKGQRMTFGKDFFICLLQFPFITFICISGLSSFTVLSFSHIKAKCAKVDIVIN